MSTFEKRINIKNFSIEDIDTTEIDELTSWLPKNGIIDINIAEQGLTLTLHAQNLCQEQIIKIEHFISLKEGQRNKAWTNAALNKASEAGHKTAKNREWFAQADEDYIQLSNEVAIAKAAKRFFEQKISFFSSWFYALKSFLNRDYSLEKLGNFQVRSSSTIEEEQEEKWVDEE